MINATKVDDLEWIDIATGMRDKPWEHHINRNVEMDPWRLHTVVQRFDGVLIQVFKSDINQRLSFRLGNR